MKFFKTFCRNRNHIVPRACNTRLLKACAEICSSYEIGSAYSQHAIKLFPHMISIRMLKFSKNTQKYQIKMHILTINNRNFQKSSRTPSNRTKVKILKKAFLDSSSTKFSSAYARSVTAEMFEHRNSGENLRKRSEIFFENLRRAYKDLI
jgi:hypothetical protein